MHFQRRKQAQRGRATHSKATQLGTSRAGTQTHVQCKKNKVSIDWAAQKVPGRQAQCFI